MGAQRLAVRHYLRRDEDPPEAGYLALLARQARELRGDLAAARRAWGRTTALRLAGHLLAYHWAMATGRRLTTGTTATVRLRAPGTRLTAHFRRDASDLFVLREVFTHQVYAFPYERYTGQVRRVVDLGSNIGLSALYFALRYPAASVACVEPVPDNLPLLRRNSEANGLGWHVERAAIGSRDGETTLYRSAWWSSSSTTGAVAEARNTAAHRPETELGLPELRVRTMTVGSLLARLGWDGADVLKMDIEGAEEDVLLHGDLDWLSRIGVLVLDIHSKYVDGEAIRARLAEAGLRPAAEQGAHAAVFVRGRA